jgi:hypothetical protein
MIRRFNHRHLIHVLQSGYRSERSFMYFFFGVVATALKAVIEALRMNPDRYKIIYNSKYDNNDNDNIFDNSNSTASAPISSSSPYPSPSPHSLSTKVHQNYYYNEYHEGISEIANSFVKILTNQMVDKTMVAVAVEEK